MRNLPIKALALILTMVAALGADNTLANSKLPRTNPATVVTVAREESDGGAKERVAGERAEGTKIDNDTAKSIADGLPNDTSDCWDCWAGTAAASGSHWPSSACRH